MKFLNAKNDKLLPQVQQVNEKLKQHTQSINAARDELGKVKKSVADAMSQREELSQDMHRDCLEISGIKPSDECTCENIVTSIGKAIDVPITKEEISIAHQIPLYKADAPPKIIVKFIRRDTRNRFYGSHRKLANKKVKDLPDLNLTSTENVQTKILQLVVSTQRKTCLNFKENFNISVARFFCSCAPAVMNMQGRRYHSLGKQYK